MLARVWSAALVGIEAVKVGVEVDISGGLPGIIVVGLPDAAIQESKERVKAALKNAGFTFPQRRVVVNLTPGDLRKEGSGFDLPIAVGVLLASEQVGQPDVESVLFLGEVSLDGSLRPVTGILPMAATAQRIGFSTLVVPSANAREAALVQGLRVYGFEHLSQVGVWLAGTAQCLPVQVDLAQELHTEAHHYPDLEDVKGQAHARRALEIAAAGGHNLILVGPPGSGKTMLARRLPGILPPLSLEEALEVTKIHSVAGLLSQRQALVNQRPFRSPHHSASGPALIGGGSVPRPGEVSLASLGILYLDELTEFKRDVLEFLRQPLEDGHVTVSRARQTVAFPARFTLVASTNPCACGYYGDPVQACTCTPRQRQQYWGKLSGPLLDRIDLQVMVSRLQPEEILQRPAGENSRTVAVRVQQARELAQTRLAGQGNLRCNAQLQPRHLRLWCQLNPKASSVLEGAIRRLGLSARASDRILKVARTIADLAGDPSFELQERYVLEAIQYRSLDRLAGPAGLG